MVLNKVTKVFPLPDKKGKHLCRFIVTCSASGKVFKISATDEREKSEWLCAIKEVSILKYNVHMYVCTYVHMCVHVCACVCVYVCMCICVCMCEYHIAEIFRGQ